MTELAIRAITVDEVPVAFYEGDRSSTSWQALLEAVGEDRLADVEWTHPYPLTGTDLAAHTAKSAEISAQVAPILARMAAGG